MHLVAIEWYKIFSLTVPSTWIAFVLAAVLTGLILYVKFGKEASSQFGDLVFVFIVVWKLSVVLTDFTTVIKHPLTILYFSGEKVGVYIGIISIIFYLLYLQVRHKPFLSIDALIYSFISFYTIFAVGVVLFNQSTVLEIVQTLIVVIFIGWSMEKYKETIRWIPAFLLVYGALHVILKESIVSTSMITSIIFGIILLLRGRVGRVFMSKSTLNLSILAILFSAILWTTDEAIDKQNQENALQGESSVDNSATRALAPNFVLDSISGEEMSLADLKGQRVILNFWATWCPPCKAEMPHMQNYFEEHAEEQIATILAVNLTDQDNGLQKIQQFISDYELTFPVVLDVDGKIANQYGIITIPTTFILDEEGNIERKISGPVSEEMLISLLAQMD